MMKPGKVFAPCGLTWFDDSGQVLDNNGIVDERQRSRRDPVAIKILSAPYSHRQTFAHRAECLLVARQNLEAYLLLSLKPLIRRTDEVHGEFVHSNLVRIKPLV